MSLFLSIFHPSSPCVVPSKFLACGLHNKKSYMSKMSYVKNICWWYWQYNLLLYILLLFNMREVKIFL